MGKAGRWLRSILAGKKGGGRRGDRRGQSQCDSTPLAELPVAASPREKRRWSFRRPAPPVKTAAAPSPLALEPGGLSVAVPERELEQSKHAVAVAMAAADAAVIRLTPPEAEDDINLYATPVQEAAAARIQATFRGYLARKALCALRGLVKLQALIRGHLVKKQARATLRRLQDLLMAQTGVRAQRMRMLEDEDHAAAAPVDHWSPQHPRRRRSYVSPHASARDGQVRRGACQDRRDGHGGAVAAGPEQLLGRGERTMVEGRPASRLLRPRPVLASASAAFTEITSPRAYSGRFEDFEPATTRVSAYVPAGYAADEGESASEFFPNYMANTQSSRAKARSQSAPKQRPDSPSPLERQPSRRRGGPAPLPRSVKMQRSSSHVGVPCSAAATYAHYYPWPVKLDRSSASLHESECGSTSSILTASTTVGYSRSMVGFEVHRNQY
ncbi:hypothetical protein ZWY2020_012934 [Hordeum vulgare]|nr:hypothetical protein ZWY2020_012934 [Hordeum vulgare]